MAPNAFVSIGKPVKTTEHDLDPSGLEEAVELELDAIHAFLSHHGEAFEHEWPDAQAPLPRALNGAPTGR
jgi:hypothetical protein